MSATPSQPLDVVSVMWYYDAATMVIIGSTLFVPTLVRQCAILGTLLFIAYKYA